ncbi:MAG: 30S ribosome-binding factor RbfA [Burkholderiales bacterium]|nr:30S ribosome-binding factor RbfA [Burkholderiales bacterium]
MRSTPRTRRVADQIQRELAEIIREDLKDPRVRMVTVTGVEVTTDLAHAKVYFSALADAAELAEIGAGLRRARGFLRSGLGRRMRIHNIPELSFVHDASVEQGVRLSRLIDEAVAGSRGGDAE